MNSSNKKFSNKILIDNVESKEKAKKNHRNFSKNCISQIIIFACQFLFILSMISTSVLSVDGCMTKSQVDKNKRTLKFYQDIRWYDDGEIAMILRKHHCDYVKNFCTSGYTEVQSDIGKELCTRMMYGDYNHQGICRVIFPGQFI